jgi:hypothetical protein
MRFCILLLSSGSVTSAQSTSFPPDLTFLEEEEEGGASGLLALELGALYLLLRGDMAV